MQRVLIFGACLVLAPVSMLCAQPNADDSIYADLLFVPANVDTIIVARDIRLLRRTPVGQTVADVFEDLVTLPRTMAAWSELADMLGFDDEVALDEILGRRVVFVGRDADDADLPAQWALVCDVRPQVASALRKKLKATPRRILKGVPLLAIEEGRFEMAVIGKRKGTNRVVFAPAPSVELMREIARLLVGDGGDVFVRTDPARRLNALGNGDAIFWRRAEPSEKGGAEWIGGVFRAEHAMLRSEVIIKTAKTTKHVTPTSIELFDALRSESLLVIVESIDPDDHSDDAPAANYLAEVQSAVNNMLEQTGANRYALTVQAADAGGITAAIGVRTPDAKQAAVAVDGVMNDLLIRLSGQLGLGAWDFDYAGLRPEARRVADLGHDLKLLGNQPLEITWGAHDDQWWVASLPGSAGRDIADAVDGQSNELTRRWLVVGSVRLGLLLETLAQSISGWKNTVPAPLTGLQKIDELTWTAWRQTDTEVLGRIEFQVRRDD